MVPFFDQKSGHVVTAIGFGFAYSVLELVYGQWFLFWQQYDFFEPREECGSQNCIKTGA